MKQCPVCWRPVSRTGGGNIYAHRDSLGRDICPGSSQPYHITIAAVRNAA